MCDATYTRARSTQRDFCRLQQIVHNHNFLNLIFAFCDLLLQLRNWHVGLFQFYGRFVLAQLISCFSSTAMPVAVSVKKPVCRGRLLQVDEDATLLSVLRVALEDNKSLNYTLRILTPETWRSRRRPAPCLFSHHRRKRSSGAQSEEARDSGLELVTRTRSTVQYTRAAGRGQRLSSGSEATGTKLLFAAPSEK